MKLKDVSGNLKVRTTHIVIVLTFIWVFIVLQIVQRYDILLLQEIRDVSETAIETLVDAVNTDLG